MKLITFHRINVNVSYKNSLCSCASVFYLFITVLAILVPLYLVLWLTPRVWLESVHIWEQPQVQFKYQYNLIGRGIDGKSVACSSFPYMRAILDLAKDRNTTNECSSLKVTEEDFNNDGRLDEIAISVKAPGELQQISLQLFFDLKLSNFCKFHNIPTVLLFDGESTKSQQIRQNLHYFDLKLVQRVAFNCPILFRHQETLFKPLNLTSRSLEDYTAHNIHRRINDGPGHFHFALKKSFQDFGMSSSKAQKFVLTIPEIMIRFETPVWHKVFNVWIKFISIYILFFFAAKYAKDYAYGNYWIRSWEIIPWKKIY